MTHPYSRILRLVLHGCESDIIGSLHNDRQRSLGFVKQPQIFLASVLHPGRVIFSLYISHVIGHLQHSVWDAASCRAKCDMLPPPLPPPPTHTHAPWQGNLCRFVWVLSLRSIDLKHQCKSGSGSSCSLYFTSLLENRHDCLLGCGIARYHNLLLEGDKKHCMEYML